MLRPFYLSSTVCIRLFTIEVVIGYGPTISGTSLIRLELVNGMLTMLFIAVSLCALREVTAGA